MQRIRKLVDICSFVLGAVSLLSVASSLSTAVHADVDVTALLLCNDASCTCPSTTTTCGGTAAPADCQKPCGCRSGQCINNP